MVGCFLQAMDTCFFIGGSRSHQVDLAYNDLSFLGLTLVKNPSPTK